MRPYRIRFKASANTKHWFGYKAKARVTEHAVVHISL